MTEKQKEMSTRNLTEAQKARIPHYVEKWTAIRDSQEPADRPLAEKGILKAYKEYGYEEPMILWTGSPYGNAKAMVALTDSELFNAEISKKLKIKPAINQDRVDDAIMRCVSMNQEWLNQEKFSENGISETALETAIMEHIAVWEKDPAVINRIANVAFDSNYGQHDAAWLAFYDLFRHEDGRIEETEKHLGAMDIAMAANWWYPTDKICFVCERPKVFYDGVNRIHHDTEKAIQYPDGFGIYVWHSYMIDARYEWFCDDRTKLNPEVINKESNAEIRRIMLEMYGYDRYFDEAGGKVIDRDENHGEPRELISMTVAGEDVQVLRVVNGSLEPDGTKRKFILGAMPDNNGKVHNAVAASYGFSPDSYKEAVRA